MTAVTGQAARGGLAFATPGDWFPVRLPHGRPDVDRMAGEVTATRPGLPIRRDVLVSMLGQMAEASAALNVTGAYATILDIPGGPLPATLLVSVRGLGGLTLDEIAAEMSTTEDSALAPPIAKMFDLPAGRTVRIERFQEWPGAADRPRPVSFTVQYVTVVPGGGRAVLMMFSTPAIALTEQLRPLFHQIACTLRFEGPERER
jgi:hypothetical protein